VGSILPFDVSNNIFTVIFIAATLAATEELGIVLLNKEVDLNQKSIFKKTTKNE